MKSDIYPNGLALVFVAKARKANKPSDAFAMIDLEVELDWLQLKGVREFYTDMVGVMDKMRSLRPTTMCMLTMQKNNDALFARLILYELKSDSPDIDRLCYDVLEIQWLTKSRSKGHSNDKVVHVSAVDGEGTLKRICQNCGKVCNFKAWQCKKCKGGLHGGCTDNADGGNAQNSNSNKKCICGMKGHKETEWFEKFSKKAPAWYNKKNAKTE